MAYTVLARRYRSAAFDQVIGQEPIAKTLCSAIATDRVAHAYLFCGTRGVGKTSMARIFACALNAPDAIADAPKPPEKHTFPPKAVQKRMGEAIMQGEDLNVIEIDGASHGGVDEARQLIANAGLAPTGHAFYKVYIIDEVHMLSTAAFNALLKTMEEPPGHVKFILCTTEPHKVPATIQSRCQRFDFRNIPTTRIAQHLHHVLKGEKVTADDQVVWRVARLANGSMRDGLSLLDRLIAATDVEARTLSPELLEQMLGLPRQELIEQVVDALAESDVALTLERSAALLEQGISQDQLVEALIERLRQLMLLAACGADSKLVELSDDAKAEAAEQAGRFDVASLVYMIALCENLQRTGKLSANPGALLDATMVRLALAEKMADVTALLRGSTGDDDHSAQKKKKQLETDTSPSAPPVQPTPAAAEELTGEQLWQRLLEAVNDKPSMAWVRSMALVELAGKTLRLTLQPGHRDLAGFVTDAKRDQLACLLESATGRRLRITVDTPADGDAPDPGRRTPDSGLSATRPVTITQEQRAEAMDLPLVKKVTDVFRDASLVGVSAEYNEAEADAPDAGTEPVDDVEEPSENGNV